MSIRQFAVRSGGPQPAQPASRFAPRPFAPQRPREAPAPVQRLPADTYEDAPPANDGTYWDTDDLTDHNGAQVPEDQIAVMKDPDYGSVPSVNPPGWAWLRGKFGRLKGQWVRFHIINAELGGPGNNATNLVPTTVALNHNGGWRQLEDWAKNSAKDDDDWTYVEVHLEYDDDYPAGIPETIRAEKGYWTGNAWVKVGGTVNLGQADPDVGEANNYLPAGQVTQGMLQGFGLNLAQARAAKELIDDTWDDQDDFDSAWAGDDMNYDEVGDLLVEETGVQGRMYVDEDEDIDGPYPVVVRVT